MQTGGKREAGEEIPGGALCGLAGRVGSADLALDPQRPRLPWPAATANTRGVGPRFEEGERGEGWVAVEGGEGGVGEE